MPEGTRGLARRLTLKEKAYAALRTHRVRDPAMIPHFLPLSWLNTVAQVRKHIEEVDLRELADSIASSGQQSPGAVAAVAQSEIDEYLDVINMLWGTAHTRRDLKRTRLGDSWYYLIVIFGHRRLAAVRLLKREQKGDWRYLANVHLGLRMTEVIRMQLAENLYVPPPKHREVEALSRMWRFEQALAQKEGRKLTAAAFAKTMGRSVAYVRDLLRFITLPPALQERIDPKSGHATMSYSLLLEVARLVAAWRRHGRLISDEEVERLADSLLVKNVKAAIFAKEVSVRIAELETGQGDIFADGSLAPSRRVIREVAAQNLVLVMLQGLDWGRRVALLMSRGAFDRPPLGVGTHAPQGAGRMGMRQASMLLELLAPLQGTIAAQERRKVRGLPAVVEELPVLVAKYALLAEVEAAPEDTGGEAGTIVDEKQGGLW